MSCCMDVDTGKPKRSISTKRVQDTVVVTRPFRPPHLLTSGPSTSQALLAWSYLGFLGAMRSMAIVKLTRDMYTASTRLLPRIDSSSELYSYIFLRVRKPEFQAQQFSVAAPHQEQTECLDLGRALSQPLRFASRKQSMQNSHRASCGTAVRQSCRQQLV